MEAGLTEGQAEHACMQAAMAAIGHQEYRWSPGIPDERGISHESILYQGPDTTLYLTMDECERVRRAYINCLPGLILQETDEGPMGASVQQVMSLVEKAGSTVRSKSTLAQAWFDFYDNLAILKVYCKKPIYPDGVVHSAVNRMHNLYFSKERARTSISIKYSLTVPGQTGKRIAVIPEKFQQALDDATNRAWQGWNEVDPKFRAVNLSQNQIRQKVENEIRLSYIPGRPPTVDDFVASMRKYMEERLRAYRATTPGRLNPAVWDAIGEYAAKEVKIDLEAVSGYFLPADFTEFCKYASGIILEFMSYTKGPRNQEAYYLSHDAPITVLTSAQYSEWVRGR